MRKLSRSRIVRSLRGGQVTIPAEFRRELGIGDDTLLRVTLNMGELSIRPVEPDAIEAPKPWFQEAYDAFADVRAHLAQYSEQEINDVIDQALAEVRRERG